VKHIDEHLNPETITEALAAAGLTVTPAQASLLLRHVQLVLAANTRMNLTRITASADVLDLHIVDSLAFLAHIEPPSGAVLDMGSGAGFPGIPLAILGYNVTLCESVKKKAAFLSETIEALELDCAVTPLRAEDLAVTSPAAFGTVTARALSSLPALVELASPLLQRDGRLIALKGRLETAERLQADAAARLCGMSPTEVVSYSLPRGESRAVCASRKTGRPRLVLPRRPGMAQRQPLGAGPT